MSKAASPPTLGQRLDDIAWGRNQGDVLVCLFVTAPFCNTIAGMGLKEYYFTPAAKLRAQTWLQDQLPGCMLWPGIWADFGAFGEPSAFGCQVRWPQEGGMPRAEPVITSPADMDAVRPPNPARDGLLPRALEDLRYFWQELEPRFIEQYGHLEGVGVSFGPTELAAVLLGHQNFFFALFDEPARLHNLLTVTTEAVIAWLTAQQKVNGRLKRITLPDHLAGQISREHCQEFVLPYLNQVIAAFPGALVMYHNEYPVSYPEALRALKAQVFHFGGELEPVKDALGRTMTLMGNLDPVGLLAQSTPEEIYRQAVACLQSGAQGGRFLLSAGGGLAPDTSLEALAALDRAVEWFRANRDKPDDLAKGGSHANPGPTKPGNGP